MVYVECMLCGACECYINFDSALHALEHIYCILLIVSSQCTHNSQLLNPHNENLDFNIVYPVAHVISQ